MKRTLLVSIVLLSSMQSFTQKVESAWTPLPLQIDGDFSDWSDIQAAYDKESGLNYRLANDGKDLYLCFEFLDRVSRTKLMTTGFSVDFQLSTKPKRKASLVFPNQGRPVTRRQTPQTVNEVDRIKQYILEVNTAETIGFRSEVAAVSRGLSTTDAFTWEMAWTDGTIKVEIKIPLSEFYDESYTLTDMADTKFKITPKLHAWVMPNASFMQRPSGVAAGRSGGSGRPAGGGRSGAGGGRPGGGQRPAMSGASPSGGYSADRAKMTSLQSFKIKLTLATK